MQRTERSRWVRHPPTNPTWLPAARRSCPFAPILAIPAPGTLGDHHVALRVVMEAAIVGLGPWGLCALERMVSGARLQHWPGGPARIHVIEPGAPGSGVYSLTQPDYLLLNNPCGQLSMYVDPMEGDAPRYGLGLFAW